jgi:hypothetical protein
MATSENQTHIPLALALPEAVCGYIISRSKHVRGEDWVWVRVVIMTGAAISGLE